MSATVWHSSVMGGDAVPEKSRSLIGNYPMFNYSTTPSAEAGASNGVQPEE